MNLLATQLPDDLIEEVFLTLVVKYNSVEDVMIWSLEVSGVFCSRLAYLWLLKSTTLDGQM